MKNMGVRLLGAVVFAASAAHVCRDSLLSWALFILGGCALVLVLYEGKQGATTAAPVEIRARPLELQVCVLGADAKPLTPIKPPAPVPAPAETDDADADADDADKDKDDEAEVPARTQAETNEFAESIISALTNLKVPKDKARTITIRVLTEQPDSRDLGELIMSAIRALQTPARK